MDDRGDRSPPGAGADNGGDMEPETDSPLTIEIVESGGDWSALAPAEPLLAAATAAVAARVDLGPRLAAVAVVLGSDAEVRRLNRLWRGRDEPTNVLSFSAPQRFALPDGRRFLGDVVLAAETICREAALQQIPLPHHVRHLVVHGVLHLLGYDHETDAAAEEMERLEADILANLGIANPYA